MKRGSILERRSVGFGIVLGVYLGAAVFGIGIYRLLSFEMWLSLLIADVAATAAVFVFSLIFRNASVYDPYWSVQPPVILLGLSFGAKPSPGGLLCIIAVCLWAVRLTANWAYTFHGLGHQDWRYTMLKEKTGPFYPVINFVGIHMVPTLVVWACTLPGAYAVCYGGGANVLTWAGFAVSLFAAVLQCTADVQMHSFRKRGTGGFIRIGLWRYSRHPNYLGEILMWWGIALLGVSLFPDKLFLLGGALANTLLFAFVSIPMAERRQARKPGFESYKKETGVLIGLPKTLFSRKV